MYFWVFQLLVLQTSPLWSDNCGFYLFPPEEPGPGRSQLYSLLSCLVLLIMAVPFWVLKPGISLTNMWCLRPSHEQRWVSPEGNSALLRCASVQKPAPLCQQGRGPWPWCSGTCHACRNPFLQRPGLQNVLDLHPILHGSGVGLK